MLRKTKILSASSLSVVLAQVLFLLVFRIASAAPPTSIEIEAKFGKEKISEVANSVMWKKLLHYHHFTPFLSSTGEVDGDGFYLSKGGRTDPYGELIANLIAFEINEPVGKLKQPALCAFPERIRFIKSTLGADFQNPKKGDCKHYDEFISKMNPQGVALVFSSAYASNPGSMFGHTFLKINTGRKSDLLDRGVSFAATVPPDQGGPLYILFGLFGGFPGQYSFLPYNEKVQEYINAENRDLWEYTLDFTPEEARRLVDHLWEMESNSWFDYLFINKNCSYQLLAALEVVKPEWDLASGWVWVVPAETVKRVISMPNSVKEIRYRPSMRKRMLQSLSLLSDEEKETFQKLVNFKIEPKDVNSPNVLSTTIQYIQYHRAESPGVNRSDLFSLWDKTLERRSQLPKGTVIETYQQPPAAHPEHGHGPIRVGLSGGGAKFGSGSWAFFNELHLKPAYHDIMNNDLGYPSYSEIDFPNLTLRYYSDTQNFVLEQLQLIGMVTIFPMGMLEKRTSWKVDIGVQNPKDYVCGNCYVFHGGITLGASLYVFSEANVIYALGGAYFELGSVMGRVGRIGPEVEVGFMTNPWQPYKLRLKANFYGDLFQPDRAPGFANVAIDQSVSFSQHWETRLEGRHVFPLFTQTVAQPGFIDGRLILQYYF